MKLYETKGPKARHYRSELPGRYSRMDSFHTLHLLSPDLAYDSENILRYGKTHTKNAKSIYPAIVADFVQALCLIFTPSTLGT